MDRSSYRQPSLSLPLSTIPEGPRMASEPLELSDHPPHRMPQLDLSRLGLSLEASSPWLLVLLIGTSWLLARVLAQIYTYYGTYRHLRGFPQPRKRNWFLGHLGLVSVAADCGSPI